jgi:outer membrane protein assembly factor BamE (lipoprotein component of BamABCDE complex)
MIKTHLVPFGALVLVACAVAPAQRTVSYGEAKSNLAEGKTTKVQVLELFGAPNITERDTQGNDVWMYSKVSQQRYSQHHYIWIVIFGTGGQSSSSSQETFDLLMKFDRNGVLSSYTVRESRF